MTWPQQDIPQTKPGPPVTRIPDPPPRVLRADCVNVDDEGRPYCQTCGQVKIHWSNCPGGGGE